MEQCNCAGPCQVPTCLEKAATISRLTERVKELEKELNDRWFIAEEKQDEINELTEELEQTQDRLQGIEKERAMWFETAKREQDLNAKLREALNEHRLIVLRCKTYIFETPQTVGLIRDIDSLLNQNKITI